VLLLLLLLGLGRQEAPAFHRFLPLLLLLGLLLRLPTG
jgi:hypothetical protein